MKILRFAIPFLLFLTMSTFDIFAQNPDFAFPQTVSKTAERDLDKTISHNDAHAALNALIRYYISQSLIDSQSVPNTIAKMESVSEKFADNPIAGIFYLLQATAYSSFYKDNQWNYDSRELPMQPRPADITEWNGAMFREKIAELCQKSVANPQALSACKIEDYKDIVSADSLTAYYFPTLLDFACSQAAQLNDLYENKYFQLGQKYSPETLLWQCKSISEYDSSNDVFESLTQLYEDNKQNEHSGIVLTYCYDNIVQNRYQFEDEIEDDNDVMPSTEQKLLRRQKWILDAIDQYLAAFPNSMLNGQLSSEKKQIEQKRISVELPCFVAPGKEFELRINSCNANKININVYKIPSANPDKYSDPNNKIYNSKPYKTITVELDNAVPFKQKMSEKVTLDEIGYYAFLPDVPNAKGNKQYVSMTLCIDKMPAAFTNAAENYAVVVDPVTGAPLAGQQLIVNFDNKYYDAPLTDKNGISDITGAVRRTKYNHGKILLKNGADLYDFDDIYASIEKSDNNTYSDLSAQVLTDRAIYRPGDKVQFLTILSSQTKEYNKKPVNQLVGNKKLVFVLYDANHQALDTIIGDTDEWGRFNGEFTLPAEGLTGRFTIEVKRDTKIDWHYYGSRQFIVSEYKMPDFELIDLNVAKDTPTTGAVTISGKARMYSGMPLANAQISMILSTGTFWRWFSPDEKIWSTEVATDAQGAFSIVVDSEVLKPELKQNWFIAQLDATSPTGTSASASQVFTMGKQYAIYVEIPSGNINGELPFKPEVKVYGPDGNPAKIDLRWAITQDRDTIMSGNYDAAGIDISTLNPGNYAFVVSAIDQSLADPVSNSFCVFNCSTDIVPGTSPLWLEFDNIDIDANEKFATIRYGVKDDAYLYYALGVGDNIIEIKNIKAAKGYHELKIALPDDFTDGNVCLLTVLDFVATSRTVNITRREESGLKIVAESFRDKLIPRNTESWKFNIVDAQGKPVQAAFAIDMYNKALESLARQYFGISFPKWHPYTSLSISNPYFRNATNIYTERLQSIDYQTLVDPEFYFYGQSFSRGYISGSRNLCLSGNSILMEECVMSYDMAAPRSAEKLELKASLNSMADAAVEGEEAVTETAGSSEDNGENSQQDDFEYREASMPLALWVPMMTSDADGIVTYSFQVPNAVTTWRLQCIAWSRDMQVGSMLRDLVASKPVMAQANAPRFLRVGDKAVISALVMNNTETTDTIVSVIQIFDPLSGQILKEETIATLVDAMSSATVDIEAYADGNLSAIGYRIRSTMGTFTDGEQTVVPILSSMAQLIETEPFYLNPGDTSYSTTLPKAEDARISLTFSENPAWSIVSALPGLRTQIDDYANSAAAALFSAALAQGIIADNPNIAKALREWIDNPSDSALVSMLQKNEDLKIALLNATPWVESAMSDTDRMARLANIFDKKETDRSINKAIEILADLQRSDGGWAWGKWCDKSSLWVTSNVIEMLGDLYQAHWMPANKQLDKMISKALQYYDREVSTLRPSQKELHPDLLYAILRPRFYETPISEGGKKVIAITLSDIEKNWKSYASPSYKSMAAMALYYNGRNDKARLLMSSVSEFGVRTLSQGIRFPNVDALNEYAIILKAFATIDPNSQNVDGLRQQLIVRKQGTDWGSAVVTSQVVAAILSCGSTWTVPAQGATVMAGDHLISPAMPIEKYTGSMKADLSAYAGEHLHIATSGSGPAYGAVYAQFQKVMDSVEPYACDDLSIVKQMTVRRGTEWEMLPDTLLVGDRVKIQLTIHCKRDLDYLTIVDERAACFEPVDQIPGWLWSEGAGFYRENRDATTNLFVISLRPGTYLLTYEMNVSNAGAFSSGVATIQSQYAPEISAHSQGNRITSSQK